MEIFTGSFKYCNTPKCISISPDGDKPVGYKGSELNNLAPKKDWYEIWKANIGQISEEENLRYFVENYYETVLSKIGIDEILGSIEEDTIFVTSEDSEEFSPRNIVAAFIELYTEHPVHEVKVAPDGKLIKQKPNKYYQRIKEMLEILIKDSIDMHGFNSIAASYLYSVAESMNDDDCYTPLKETYLRYANILEKNHNQKEASNKIL